MNESSRCKSAPSLDQLRQLERPSSAASDPFGMSAKWTLLKKQGSSLDLVPSRQTSAHRNMTVWRSATEREQFSGKLPPLVKGANRHRCPPAVQRKLYVAVVEAEVPEVDMDAAESYGRTVLGADPEEWVTKVFEASDTSESGYICPAEFTAFVAAFVKQLGSSAEYRMGERIHFTAADTSLEGRVSVSEFRDWSKVLLEEFNKQRCIMAAARFLGMRKAEGMIRKRVKNVELYEGFSASASRALLTACVSHANPSLSSLVHNALAAKADPNAALFDPFHNGYTAIICLAMAPPTINGKQAAESIEALIKAGADPYRESGWMPFGKWTPLRFGAFMQNEVVLDCLLSHVDKGSAWIGNRFLWAASENVGYIMTQELEKEYNDKELMKQVRSKAVYDILATVLLQQYASPIAPGNLWAQGAKQLIAGEFQSGALPKGSRADPNGPGLEGLTALMNIVMEGEAETAKALLKGRALPNLKDSSGATALHHAASRLQVGMVRTLLQYRADPSETDHSGLTPWMLVGEETAHERIDNNCYAPRPDGQRGNPDSRRELLEILRPHYSAEEIVEKLQEDWSLVVDPEFLGTKQKVDLELLAERLRLHESLFFSSVLADGHGAHEGRRERVDLLTPLAGIMMDLLREKCLEGDKKILTRYLLMATMGPSQTNCAHLRSPWPTKDNREMYRDSLKQVAETMLDGYADECNRMRDRIDFMAESVPTSACAALSKLPKDQVSVPDEWRSRKFEDHVCWREVQKRNHLRFDPPWALEVGDSPARCCMALLRLGTIDDISGFAKLVQVHHAPHAEMLARGYITYSNLCNERFQDKMKEIAQRAVDKHGLDVDMGKPGKYVPAKKLKRLMEKIREKRVELAEEGIDGWPGRDHGYFSHSQAFYILDTVRLAFTCEGKSFEKQVECCMKLVDEFKACTAQHDKACILRTKNGFAQGVYGAGGYADVKLLVYADLGTHKGFDGMEIPLQIVGEVQIILSGYMEVKHKMHLVYEVNRGSFDHKPKSD